MFHYHNAKISGNFGPFLGEGGNTDQVQVGPGLSEYAQSLFPVNLKEIMGHVFLSFLC